MKRITGGVKTAATSAVFGGVILALIEGIGIMITRMSEEQFKPVRPMEPPMPMAPSPIPVPSSSSYPSSSSSSAAYGSSSPSSSSPWSSNNGNASSQDEEQSL